MNLPRRVVVTCVVLIALTLPLFAAGQPGQDLDAPDTGNPAWDEAFLEEYEELLAESGIPPEVAALVLSELPRGSTASDPEEAAAIAMRETARVDAAVRRGSLPNQAAAEARSRLQTALQSASRDGESPAMGEGPPRDPGAAASSMSNRALEALERNRGPRGPRGPAGAGTPSGRRGESPALPDGVQEGGEEVPDDYPSGTPDVPDEDDQDTPDNPANTPDNPGPSAVDPR